MFKFAKLLRVNKQVGFIELSIEDPDLKVEGAVEGYKDYVTIDSHRSLIRLRILIQRLRMRKLWVMARRGRFDNVRRVEK